MTGYTVRDVAELLGVSSAQVRSYAGFLSASRGARGEYRFSFQDVVLLRAVRGLVASRVPAARLKRSLRKLRQQLPGGRPLSAVRISADGRDVVVREGGTTWNPDSGQVLLDFAVADLAAQAAPIARRSAAAAREAELDAAGWYDLAYDLEAVDPSEARDAYLRALALDPGHADAHVNLGRLLHEASDLAGAEGRYRAALAARPDHPTAGFNLGVALEDQGRHEEAAAAYEAVLAADPRNADAHYNLALLFERAGRVPAALCHLKAYRDLVLARRP